MPPARLNPAIQFFASPAEFGEWAAQWVRDHGLQFLFARSLFRAEPPTFEVLTAVPWGDPAMVAEAVRTHHALYLSRGPLNADVSNFNLLPGANLDHLRINLPRLSERGLGALSLGSASRVADSLAAYRAVARDLMARTEAGVWFRKEGHRKQTLEPGMRYGPGAAALMAHGVPLCGGGKTVVARLGPSRSAAS
jgi:hypothetical protein